MQTTIMLVDDEPHIREVVQLTLESLTDWRVVAADSGAAALELASSEMPDLVLLDVMMPAMDGPTTLGHLRDNPRTADIPVAFLTAKAQASDRRRYEELGVQGVIVKPFDPLRLPEEVRLLLECAPAASPNVELTGAQA